nr:uncharacterized protein LOC112936133 [Oryza sativa Japonica Group]
MTTIVMRSNPLTNQQRICKVTTMMSMTARLLPDGWIMEVYLGDDGTIYRYYICPVSGRTFTMKSEVLHYLFSEMDQCFTESKNRAVGSNLTRTHEWLPKGWLVEIRAGGDNMDKMYKVAFPY